MPSPQWKQTQGQAGRVLPGSSQEIRAVSGNSPSRVCSPQLGPQQTPSPFLVGNFHLPLMSHSGPALCRQLKQLAENIEREAHPTSQHISPDSALLRGSGTTPCHGHCNEMSSSFMESSPSNSCFKSLLQG